MQIKLEKTEKSTATVSIVVPVSKVKEEEEHTLSHLSQTLTIKGFRKGKAPLNVVKQNLKVGELREETIHHVLGHVIGEAIKDLKLKVIANPRLIKSETPDNADWQFTLELPLYPEIKLGEYKDKINKALSKIKSDKEDDKVKAAFDTLLDQSQIDIPQALIDEEVNRSLSRLIAQAESLNLSVTDYLKSINRTPEKLREEYQKTATDSLKLDFLLFAVANDLKLEVTKEEIDKLGQTAQIKEEQKPYLKSILLKRKAVDSLIKL